MDEEDGSQNRGVVPNHRARYDEQMNAIRAVFNTSTKRTNAGTAAVEARAEVVDALVTAAWDEVAAADESLRSGVALVAVGGYGRRELFPFSDVDLMFLLDVKVQERAVKEPIRRLNQLLWDAGLRVSAMTRTRAECERFSAENVEFTLALLDARLVAGEATLGSKLMDRSVPKLVGRERRKIVTRLLDVTRTRHAKYGGTLFHLEPNIKECPGGLRDAHVCGWLARLAEAAPSAVTPEFAEAREFLLLVRTFLHFRHGRDDNTLDWQVQDEAAAALLDAQASGRQEPGADAAYWMRLYFRHARAVVRRVSQALEDALPAKAARRMPLLAALRGTVVESPYEGFEIRSNRIVFEEKGLADGAQNPEVMLAIFGAMARTGARLSRQVELRVEHALPLLSASLEDGPGLWRHLESILTGPFAGHALRAMHALGVLELLIPEFHGIDALVIRDAYHRYTVDEHTFVVVDTLHGLRVKAGKGGASADGRGDLRAAQFAGVLRELPHPALLFLAALLHDTGKGHAMPGHAVESARMAASVLARLELDEYETGLVLDLIRNHLEMSAALRRDVFDSETIRAFAARVQTPEALRMLTLFTYADICAVHPDALTPWKAENLWNLYIATANFLDRNVDEERVASAAESQFREIVQNIAARHSRRLSAELLGEIAVFLKGFPRRYLQTRTPEEISTHVEMAARLGGRGNGAAAIELLFHFEVVGSELTLVTRDRPLLFASIAGALAAWGMNIVTADGFSNADGVVVDSFRFTDTFRTLEMNDSERTRFVENIRGVMSGAASAELLLAARRRGRRRVPKVRVETRIDFDGGASSQSTLVQVVAQDTPGLLHALSLTLARQNCNIEVALIDTEGEMAIDVFYVKQGGLKLEAGQEGALKRALVEAIDENAR